MKLSLALGAGLFVVFLRAFVGPLGGGLWDLVVLVGMLLFVPVGLASERWAAVLIGFILIPAAYLADTLFRQDVGLDSTTDVLALPVALFLTPFACLLLLAGVGGRKLLLRRAARAE